MKTKLTSFLVASMCGAFIGGILSWNTENLIVKILSILFGGLVSAFLSGPKGAKERLIDYWEDINWYLIKWKFLIFLFFVSGALLVNFVIYAPIVYFSDKYYSLEGNILPIAIITIIVFLVCSSFIFGDMYTENSLWQEIRIDKDDSKGKRIIRHCLIYWNPITAPFSLIYYLVWEFLIKIALPFLVHFVFMSLLVIVYESRAVTCFVSGAMGASFSLFFGSPIIWIMGGFVAGFIQYQILGNFLATQALRVKNSYLEKQNLP